MPYSIEFLADLDRTMTRARLTRYMAAAGDNVELALQLYEKNLRLSEALFGLLHVLEVAARNSLSVVFTDDVGVEDWYNHGQPLPWRPPVSQVLHLTTTIQGMVTEARSKAGRMSSVGKVIAELPFAFWTLLIGNRSQTINRRFALLI